MSKVNIELFQVNEINVVHNMCCKMCSVCILYVCFS